MGNDSKKKKVQAKTNEITNKSPNGVNIAFPDVCKTPSPAGPVPIPYPNIAQSSDTAKGAKKVKADGNPVVTKNSNYQKSSGDEPGSIGSSAWKKIESLNKTIVNVVKEHPVLTAVTIITVIVIVSILLASILYAPKPKPFDPEEPIFSLNFWFS